MGTPSLVIQVIIVAVILLFGASISCAQDAELLRHFDYDQKAPLGIKQNGVMLRKQAKVYDIT